MEVHFKDKRVEKLCKNTKSIAARKLAKEVNLKLQKLMTRLKDAHNLQDITVFRNYNLDKLKGNISEQFSLDINKQFRLIFKPIGIIENEHKTLIYEKVEIIEIIEVSKHYDD